MADWNPAETPDYPTKPTGYYDVKVLSLKRSTTGPIKVNGRFEIIAPEEDAGDTIMKTWWLGTPEDPEAEELRTRRSNFGDWKRFLRASEVQATGNLSEECEAAEDSQLSIRVTESLGKDKDGNSTPKNYVNNYFRLGTQEARHDGDVSGAAAKPKEAEKPAEHKTVDAAARQALRDED